MADENKPQSTPKSISDKIDSDFASLAKTMRETAKIVKAHSTPKGILVKLAGIKTTTS
jgi:hypothetical protein